MSSCLPVDRSWGNSGPGCGSEVGLPMETSGSGSSRSSDCSGREGRNVESARMDEILGDFIGVIGIVSVSLLLVLPLIDVSVVRVRVIQPADHSLGSRGAVLDCLLEMTTCVFAHRGRLSGVLLNFV